MRRCGCYGGSSTTQNSPPKCMGKMPWRAAWGCSLLLLLAGCAAGTPEEKKLDVKQHVICKCADGTSAEAEQSGERKGDQPGGGNTTISITPLVP